MIKKFVSLAKDNLEGAKEFASKNFPEELLDPEHKINSNIEEKVGDEESSSRLTLPGLDFTKEEVMGETESYVKENLYKRVDKSMTDEEVQAEKEAFIKELNGSKELLEELKNHKFNPATGEKLSLSEIFSLSANKIMESKKKVPERKYDSGMDNNKITPKTDSGDSSGSYISILTNGLIK